MEKAAEVVLMLEGNDSHSFIRLTCSFTKGFGAIIEETLRIIVKENGLSSGMQRVFQKHRSVLSVIDRVIPGAGHASCDR